MPHPSRFQHFFNELPLGESQVSNAKGEFITIVKDASTVTLSKEDAIRHSTEVKAKRLNFSFTPSQELEGAYALSDCWEEDGRSASLPSVLYKSIYGRISDCGSDSLPSGDFGLSFRLFDPPIFSRGELHPEVRFVYAPSLTDAFLPLKRMI